MFGSSLPPVICRKAHVLFTLYMFAWIKWCPTHIVLYFCFVCFRLVCPMLSFLRIVYFVFPIWYSLIFIYYYSEFIFKLVNMVRTEYPAKSVVIVKRSSVTKLSDVQTQKVLCKMIICIH